MLPVIEVADEAVKEDVTEEILRIINTEVQPQSQDPAPCFGGIRARLLRK